MLIILQRKMRQALSGGLALIGVLQFQSQRFCAGKCPSPNASLRVIERTLSFKPTTDRLRR